MIPLLAVATVALTLVAQALLVGRPRIRPARWRWVRTGREAVRGRGLLIAVVAGLVLRVAWVLLVAETPPDDGNDAAEYLNMAERFLDGDMPLLHGIRPTAWFAPGYPMLLAPLIGLSNVVGGPSPAIVAALVNAVASGLTVLGAALLARRWIGPGAVLPTAWLMALAPAHIYFTASAHAESVFTALLVFLTLAAVRIVDDAPDGRPPLRPLLVLGLFVGFLVLVRSPGLAVVVVPALALRAGRGRWEGSLRTIAATMAGALVVMVPWSVANGIYVGVWSPTSTQNATVLCVGHHDLATGGFPGEDMPRQMELDCYQHAPYADPRLGFVDEDNPFGEPDEAKWYREASLRGISWALTHPLEEVRLVHQKFVRSWGTEWDALPAGKNYTNDRWAGGATWWLNGAANLWLWVVEALGLAALVLVRAARRALPVWGMGVIMAAAPIMGLAQPHFRHPAIPFLVVLAGATCALIAERFRARRAEARPGVEALSP